MQPGAYLVNVARGRCVNEPDLVAALQRGAIAAAGIDTTWEEPLSARIAALWDIENALITPHTAGETRAYEDNVVEILVENVRRMQRGEGALINRGRVKILQSAAERFFGDAFFVETGTQFAAGEIASHIERGLPSPTMKILR